MSKSKRAQLIQKILNELFPDPLIPLHHKDPYTLLVAVVLSAQCTDARVNMVTPHLFRLAPNAEKMVQLTVQDIQTIIQSCGLSRTKAKAIWGLSWEIVKKYKGSIPRSSVQLRKLPGVGRKTAAVVMAQAFHHPSFPVDTHIHRCAQRWGLSSGKSVLQTEKDLKRLFPRIGWNRLHLQIIYFARKFCPAQRHALASCPICKVIEEKELGP